MDFFETGCEGLVWALADDIHLGLEALHFINQGDYFVITDRTGKEIWSGTIDENRDTGFQAYPLNPKYGQPLTLGRWIHWTQRGFGPDDWACFFVRNSNDRFRGTLTRTNKT